MRLISMKCPECKANLSVEGGRKYCFCQYCGTKIMLEDDRVNKTHYTYRNEARIRQAEIDREIALKKLEIEKIKVEQEEKRKNKNRKIKIIVSIILAIIGSLSLLTAWASGSETPGLFGAFCLMIIIYIAMFSSIDDKK